jgi:hypothetical protein
MWRNVLAAAAIVATASSAGVPDDDLTRVANALAAGRATRAIDQRAASARLLTRLGAHPADGGVDYAVAWSRGKPDESSVLRERALGPGYRRIVIEPKGSARFDQTFLAGRIARVAVAPVRKAAFRLHVSGDQGQSYCSGTRSCEWVPAYTQRFQVRIDNRDASPTEFFIVMP